MDYGEATVGSRAVDAGDGGKRAANLGSEVIGGVDPAILGRNRGIKFEWQVVNGGAKLRPAGSIPGDNRVKALQFTDQLFRGREFEHVDTGGGDGTSPVSKAGQRQILGSGPNLYVISL